MPSQRLSIAGKIAITIAVIGGILALTNTFLTYNRTGEIDFKKIALAIGVPALIFAFVSSTARTKF